MHPISSFALLDIFHINAILFQAQKSVSNVKSDSIILRWCYMHEGINGGNVIGGITWDMIWCTTCHHVHNMTCCTQMSILNDIPINKHGWNWAFDLELYEKWADRCSNSSPIKLKDINCGDCNFIVIFIIVSGPKRAMWKQSRTVCPHSLGDCPLRFCGEMVLDLQVATHKTIKINTLFGMLP